MALKMKDKVNLNYNRENISMSVIRRLPRYYRYLNVLERKGIDKVSSKELSKKMGFTASQIRQDFNCFGGFGQQGYGYPVSQLRDKIADILKIDNKKRAVILGAGNLGRALLSIDFCKLGFELLAVFDNNPSIIGHKIKFFDILSTEQLATFCKENSVEMAIICVPTSVVKDVSAILYENGVRAFWNFSHYDISMVYEDAIVENVHLNDSLMALCYMLDSNR